MTPFRPLLTAGALVVGWTMSARAQSADPRLLSTPPKELVRCVNSAGMRPPGSAAAFRLYRYDIGVPAFQMRNPTGQMVMTGPPPRRAIAVFDQQGTPIIVIDSVFAAWATWAAEAQFDSSIPRPSYIQGSTLDSAQAMAIAMRLGPSRIMEAGDSAERLRQMGQRRPLDSAALRRARAFATLLWQSRCG